MSKPNFFVFSEVYIQCFAHISAGTKVAEMSSPEDDYGGDEKFITLKQDYSSFQQAPVWLDDAKVLYILYGLGSFLLQHVELSFVL